MNEIEALKIKLSQAKNIQDVIVCCKDWREILLRRTKMDLRKYQEPLSNKMIEYKLSEGAYGDEIIAMWCRQSGKTETVSITVLVLGTFYMIFLKEDFGCGLFAPVESMITHVTRNRVRQRFKAVRNWLQKEAGIEQLAGEGITSSIFILHSIVTDKEMTVRSLSAGESASIIGETFGMMIVEQSELINSLKLKTDIFPMGATKGGVRVLTGTTSPYFRNEYFRNAIEKWSLDPDKNKSTADYVDLVDWKVAASESVAYSRYAKKEREKLGEDSIEFRTQYNLEWVGVALKFIGWDALSLLERDYVTDLQKLRFFGLDVARSGEDSTVVTIIEQDGLEIHALAWLELRGLDFENQVSKIIEFLSRYKPLRYGLVDTGGLGVGLYELLKKKVHEIEEEKIEGKEESKDPWIRFDELYPSAPENDKVAKCMDQEFIHGRIFFPKNTQYVREKAKFIEQILDLERVYKGNLLKLTAPKMKGRHDDYPKSLAFAVYALKEKSHHSGVSFVGI